MDFPVLQTRRLELREITAADNQAIFELFSNPEVVKYYDLSVFHHLDNADRIIAFFNQRFKERSGIRWGISLKGHDHCIGTCGINGWSKAMHSASIGYDLHRDFWGQGITTEALATIIDYIFSGKSFFGVINRLQADTIPANIASQRVLAKLGFNEEGIRRQSGFWKNQYHDLKCFGLLKAEFTGRIEQ